MMEDIVIRVLDSQDMDDAVRLILAVFDEFEAPDYSEEGVREFYGSIRNDDFMNSLCFIGAFKDNELAGIIATRNEGSHIALLFVEKKFQKQGIGRKLFEHVKNGCHAEKMAVNSSPYAVEIYHRFGFRDTGPEQTVNGLRFTPMELHIS